MTKKIKKQKKIKKDKRTKQNKRIKKDKRIKKTKKYRNKNKKSIGGLKIFNTLGNFEITDELLDGKDFFRKMTNNENEIKLCELLKNNHHKNIIKIYDVGDNYIDMELLDTDYVLELNEVDKMKVKEVMQEVKSFLQGLGFMYIDWKYDNIGKSDDGEYKLFDFDASGLLKSEERVGDYSDSPWDIEPPHFWSYKQAIINGFKTPKEIDNYAFDIGMNDMS
jgi:serine/threonine protein kinase